MFEKIDQALDRALSMKRTTENSRRAFKIFEEGDRVIFKSTWKRRKLTVVFPAKAFEDRQSLVNVRKLLYVFLRAGLKGKFTVKLVADLGEFKGYKVRGKYRHHEVLIRADSFFCMGSFIALAHEFVHALQHVHDPNMHINYTRFLRAVGYEENPFEKQAYKWEKTLALKLFR